MERIIFLKRTLTTLKITKLLSKQCNVITHRQQRFKVKNKFTPIYVYDGSILKF